eukprot:CAMPEP_0196573528 /NCGR_PEP_ID=MMETSP1081-20130531/3418_1 /TAXON_ID=36882 /ORGANISM="Pyramimonas amylifera, Strain CCMP720" /LENGTH=358 /DNA_ID=CAMNT_0041891271 /DNA_START=116 /DNA_END=1192 /DNA_ORIENTATION=-
MADTAALVCQYNQFEDQLRETFVCFLSFDSAGAGTLSPAELRKFFIALNLTEGMTNQEADDFIDNMFATIGKNDKEAIHFEDYVKYHNMLVEHRLVSGLAAVDFNKTTATILSNSSGEPTSGVGALAMEMGVKAIGEVSSVHKITQIFSKADTKQKGKVAVREILKCMQEFEFFQKGTSCSTMNSETLDNYPLKKLELKDLVCLVHPSMMEGRMDLLIGKARAAMESHGTSTEASPAQAALLSKIDATTLSNTTNERDEIMHLFLTFDTNNDLQLTPEEWIAAVGDVYGADMARDIFELVDLDGSGEIDVQEFASYWKKSSEFEYQVANEFGRHLLGLIDGSMVSENSSVLNAILSDD